MWQLGQSYKYTKICLTVISNNIININISVKLSKLLNASKLVVVGAQQSHFLGLFF